GFWQRHYGGDPTIVGRDIHLNGVSFRVVGVFARRFEYLWDDIDVWAPQSFTPQVRSDESRHSNNWTMIARLKPGAWVEQAQREIDALNARNETRFPQFTPLLRGAGYHTSVARLQDELTRDVRGTLYLLWGGAFFVLLVGGVNLVNLLLVRSAGRWREL